jgi:hypothetical protein
MKDILTGILAVIAYIAFGLIYLAFYGAMFVLAIWLGLKVIGWIF